jgi:hypothetical protein
MGLTWESQGTYKGGRGEKGLNEKNLLWFVMFCEKFRVQKRYESILLLRLLLNLSI